MLCSAVGGHFGTLDRSFGCADALLTKSCCFACAGLEILLIQGQTSVTYQPTNLNLANSSCFNYCCRCDQFRVVT